MSSVDQSDRDLPHFRLEKDSPWRKNLSRLLKNSLYLPLAPCCLSTGILWLFVYVFLLPTTLVKSRYFMNVCWKPVRWRWQDVFYRSEHEVYRVRNCVVYLGKEELLCHLAIARGNCGLKNSPQMENADSSHDSKLWLCKLRETPSPLQVSNVNP